MDTDERMPDPAVTRAEQRSLNVYMSAMLGLAVIGSTTYAFTDVAATQLDGVIALINAGAAYIAARLARAAAEFPTPEAPYGRLALENLYVLFRSLMILGVIILGVITNAVKVVDYLITRSGAEPRFGWAAVYTAFAASWTRNGRMRLFQASSTERDGQICRLQSDPTVPGIPHRHQSRRS